MSKSVYEIVQEKMIKKIEEAIANNEKLPWQKPWSGRMPVNYVSRKPYRGINVFMLMDEGSEFITFKQIQELRKKNPEIKLKKGSKSEMVVFFTMKQYKEKDEETGEEVVKQRPILKYYNVFPIHTVEGLESKFETFEHNQIEEAGRVITSYVEESGIGYEEIEGFGQAYYRPLNDSVHVPAMSGYKEIEKFYNVCFHELAHSSGHPSRLNRFDISAGSHVFGSESYSKEELVAEMTASMMLGSLGINTESTEANSQAYLQGWLKAVKNDVKLLISASNQAQKACDMILGNAVEKQEQEVA